MDPQIARQIIEDMEDLKENPLDSSACDFSYARKLGLRYIKAAHDDWRLFFRIEGKSVLGEFVFRRETAYEEVARYVRTLRL
jgi:hypothetical protein